MKSNNLKPCQHPGCPAVVTAMRYCPKHVGNRIQATPTCAAVKASKSFLASKPWALVRNAKLSANPFCQECERNGHSILAEHVHHLQPRATHPHLALDPANLESLCHSCHSVETVKERSNRDTYVNALNNNDSQVGVAPKKLFTFESH